MPLTYSVDYTGVNPSNLVAHEFQLISSANYRNYKVIVPNFAPFYAIGVVVRHQSTGSVLVEGYDYILTHLFQEATHSIGRGVYGSISITNPDVNGTFDIDYQTVGGDWVLPSQKLIEILGGLVVNPRVARWEQVAGYPAQFPPINHDHSNDDLVGMSDVVTAIQAVKAAIDTAYANNIFTFATSQEALAGIISAKAMSPATVKVVIDSVIGAIADETAAGDAVINNNVSLLASDVLGLSTFINGGYKVYKDSTVWKVAAGVGYVNGRRIVQAQDQVVTPSAYPADVWLDTFDSSGSMAGILSTAPALSVTNLLRYSENLIDGGAWLSTLGVTGIANSGYNADYLRIIDQFSFDAANEYRVQTLLDTSLVPGQTYLFSAWVRGLTTGQSLTVTIGDTSSTIQYPLPTVAQRISFPVVAGDSKNVNFGLLDAGSLEIGELQVESSSNNYNLMVAGNELTDSSWTLVNAVIRNNDLNGPYTTSALCGKLTGSTTTAVHGIRTGNMSLIASQEYYFSGYFQADLSGLFPCISITVTGLGGESETLVLTLGTSAVTTSGAGLLLIRNFSVSTVGITTYRVLKFTIVPMATTTYTIQFNLHNGTSTTTTGVTGAGVWMGGLALQARGFATNLLRHSADFVDGVWSKPAAIIKPDLNGSLVVATALSENGTLVADTHLVKQELTSMRALVSYTFSVEFKAADYTAAFIRLRSGPNSASLNKDIELLVNLLDVTDKRQTVTGSGWTSVSNGVTSLGDGWYRVIITGTSPAGTMLGVAQFGPAVSTAVGAHIFIGDDIKGVRARNAFVTVGSLVSSYQVGDSYPVSKYIQTASEPRTDLDGANRLPYTSNGVSYTPVKLVTLSNSYTAIDRRRVIKSLDGIIRNTLNNYIPVTSVTVMQPNKRYYVANNATAILPPAASLDAGDIFYLAKNIDSTYRLRTENVAGDFIYYRDSYTDALLYEIELTIDVDRDIKVLFDGNIFSLL